MKKDSELRQVDFQVLFKLVDRAVVESRVAALEAKVSSRWLALSSRASFSGAQGYRWAAVWFSGCSSQLPPAHCRKVAGSVEFEQGAYLVDAGAAGRTGILTTFAFGVDNESWRGLAQGQGLFEGLQYQLSGHQGGQMPAHDPPRTGIRPSCQVAPAPTH